MKIVDAVVVGGGFYGCSVALELRRLGFARVVLAERAPDLLLRSSYVNQARVHNGYHYPRCITTAMASHRSFARFCDAFRFALHRPMQMIYAIAAGSRVSPRQFESFCATIGAPIRPAPRLWARLFDPCLIQESYLVDEAAFNASLLREHFRAHLWRTGVDVRLQTVATVERASADDVTVRVGTECLRAQRVFNCTYAQIDEAGVPVKTRIKRQLAEMALIEVPAGLGEMGVTVMDGPFFSAMPFPAEGCHSLSHVRFTHHESWEGAENHSVRPARSQAELMLRDAARYMPILSHARYVRSIFELKALLVKNADDDGRPILYEYSPASPRIVSILGSKIDNIYDVLAVLQQEPWNN